MSDHDPSIPAAGRCVGTQAEHRCDLTDVHVTGHQCVCGALFGGPGIASRAPVDRSALSVDLPVPKEWSGGGVLLEAPQPAGPPCSKCGLPMPPLPPELAAVASKLGGGVVLAHEVCPTETPAAPEGRYFEVRVQVVEVTEPEPVDDSYTGADAVQVEEMITFVAGHRAPDLDTAMRPLALALGEKWALAEKQAKVADS